MVLDAGKPHYHREILTRELESVSGGSPAAAGAPHTASSALWCLPTSSVAGTSDCQARTRKSSLPIRPHPMQVGIRLNRKPPNIFFKKKKTGGIAINSMLPLTNLDDRTIQRILQVWAAAAASQRPGLPCAVVAPHTSPILKLCPPMPSPCLSTHVACVPPPPACTPLGSLPPCLPASHPAPSIPRSTRSTTATCCSRRTPPWTTSST